jgi:ppGpp synthetase/RelA/SpoT-type nucleotidyltranferase
MPIKEDHLYRTPHGWEILVLDPQDRTLTLVDGGRCYQQALLKAIALNPEPLYLKKLIARGHRAAKLVRDELLELLREDATDLALVEARVKDYESLRAKIRARVRSRARKGEPYREQQIEDIIALRLTTQNLARQHQLAARLRTELAKRGRLRSYEEKGFAEGYRATHLGVDVNAVMLRDESSLRAEAPRLRAIAERPCIFEVQIMAQQMQKWHEWNHRALYKNPAVSAAADAVGERSSPEVAALLRLNHEWLRWARAKDAGPLTLGASGR